MSAKKMIGGRIVEIRHEADGIDLRVSAAQTPGCNCPACRAAPECWTKIAPNNLPIAVGHFVRWRAGVLVHFFVSRDGRAIRSPNLQRIGKYRKVRPDGTAAPAPANPCATMDVWGFASNPVAPASTPPQALGEPGGANPSDDTPQAC